MHYPPPPHLGDFLSLNFSFSPAHIVPKMTYFIVVGGPAGTGKSTIGEKLSEKFGCDFVEGDSLHPAKNIAKMSHGIPLTDQDRYPWLKALTHATLKEAVSSRSHKAVVSCSMLKREYRDLIRNVAREDFENLGCEDELQFLFVFLYSNFDELVRRVNGRAGHYMKTDMVKSQLDIMELPEGKHQIENGGDELKIDTTGKSVTDIVDSVMQAVGNVGL